MKLQRYTKLHGDVSRTAVLAGIARADIGLLCSEHEGLPRFLQESAALGKGIVAYANSGTLEAVRSMPFSRCVPIGDVSGAADAVRYIRGRLLKARRYHRYRPPLSPSKVGRRIIASIRLAVDGKR